MPGRTSVVNATGKPEAVLTDSQWNVASAAVKQVISGHGLGSLVGAVPGGGSRGPLIENFHAHETLDADRAVSRLAFLAGDL